MGPEMEKKKKNHEICSSDFSEIYVMTGIQIKVKVTVFHFLRQHSLYPKSLFVDVFWVQN